MWAITNLGMFWRNILLRHLPSTQTFFMSSLYLMGSDSVFRQNRNSQYDSQWTTQLRLGILWSPNELTAVIYVVYI